MTERRVILMILPLVLFSLDGTLTLLGQPTKYWSGDYSYVNERNPIGYFLLSLHPLFFLIASLLYIYVITYYLRKLSDVYAIALFIFLTTIHTFGIYTWIPLYIPYFGSLELILNGIMIGGASLSLYKYYER